MATLRLSATGGRQQIRRVVLRTLENRNDASFDTDQAGLDRIVDERQKDDDRGRQRDVACVAPTLHGLESRSVDELLEARVGSLDGALRRRVAGLGLAGLGFARRKSH